VVTQRISIPVIQCEVEYVRRPDGTVDAVVKAPLLDLIGKVGKEEADGIVAKLHGTSISPASGWPRTPSRTVRPRRPTRRSSTCPGRTARPAKWRSTGTIAARLAHEVVKPLVAGADRLAFALDETPTERYGRLVQGAGVHHRDVPGLE
jgi:hypothetical protein